jgi:hypothetical protein
MGATDVSGSDLVSGMRDGGKVPRSPAPRGGVLDLVLIVVVMIAIAGAGYFGVMQLMSPHAPPPAQPLAARPVSVAKVAWTDADTAICKAKGIRAANEPLPGELVFANSAVTEGFAGFSARLECRLLLKPTRFCDPKEKAAMVAEVNDYLGRIDIVSFGLGLQGAPMRLLGGVMGGEVEAGSGMYDVTRDATVQFMDSYQRRVAVAMRRLASDGIMAPSDFSVFLAGVPAVITRMFGDVTPKQNLCA